MRIRRPGGRGEGGSSRARFEDRARSARRLRWRPILLTLLAAALVAGLVYVVWFSSVLAVRSVVVEGVQGSQAEAVRRAADVPLGVPLARVDLVGPGQRVTRSPLYASVDVARRWPSTVLVRVEPRRPVLALDRGGDVQLVDGQGVAYLTAPEAPKGVPVVTSQGAATPEGLKTAISVLSALPPELRSSVSAVRVEGPSMVTFQAGKTKVLWGDSTEPQLKVKVLPTLLKGAPATVNVSAPHAPATT